MATWAVAMLPMGSLGTLAHELGHWAVARALGCSATLHHAWTSTQCAPSARVWVSLGGPAQTMLTGSLGVLGLWWLRHRRFGPAHLLALALSLFWSRQVFNALAWVVLSLLSLAPAAQLERGDAFRLAAHLGLPPPTLLLATAAMGTVVILGVLRQLPASQRVPFVVGGGSGALLGYALWMRILGPALLP